MDSFLLQYVKCSAQEWEKFNGQSPEKPPMASLSLTYSNMSGCSLPRASKSAHCSDKTPCVVTVTTTICLVLCCSTEDQSYKTVLNNF